MMCLGQRWWIVVCISGLAMFLTASTRAQPDSCPVFGTDQSTSLSRSTRERVFLNFEAPSQCRGNVTSWSFCYYRSGDGDESDDGFQYGAKFVVYRRADPTSTIYEPVAGSITTKLLSYSEARMGFRCLNETLSQAFEIQENDVIGACVWDRGSTNPLYLVGTDVNTDQKLYQYDKMSFERCTYNQLKSINTADEMFRLRRESKLHLYANTDVTVFCRAGNNPTATGPATGSVSGTFLDTSNAAMCSDHITSWHYCYYPSAAPADQTYTMTVAAWRLEVGTYRLVPGTNHTVTLNPIETKAKIFCMEEGLDPVDYVLVSEGDVIGVVLPSTNPIPVVSSNAGSDSSLIMHSQNTSTTDLLSSEFTVMSNSALHVYAKLELVPTTTETTTTEPQELLNATTTAKPKQLSAGLSSGTVAAVVIIILVIVIGVAVATVSVSLVFRKRHLKKSSDASALDNATYQLRSTQTGKVSLDGSDKFYEPVDHTLIAQGASPGIDQIYQEIDENEGEYYAPIASMQDYRHCLEEAKRGSMSREDPYQMPSSSEAGIFAEFKKLKIRTIAGFSIEIWDKIGSGQFGNVHEATWKQSAFQSIQVAAKTLKENPSPLDRIKFLQEAAIMAQFRHPNVVALYGVAQKAGKRMIIVELLSKGDLHQHLKALKPDPGEMVQSSVPQLLLEYSQQIALGMSYLANKGFVHRDLAARNVLVSDNNICKIADFGMSRDLQDTDYYVSSGGMIPLKWTAPEAIHYKKYSTASDVWSYGCVLYEIWSLGTKPFEATVNVEVLKIIQSGSRLPPPPGCPKRLYEVMIQSWATKATDRPEFRDILLFLLEEKSVVLKIPAGDKSSHPQAGVLGAPLEAGYKMYTTAQNTYKTTK